MICVSLADIGYIEIFSALKDKELAELRLDRLSLNLEELKDILNCGTQIIVAFAKNGDTDETRVQILLFSAQNGAKYIDIENNLSASDKRKLIAEARKYGVKTILSEHNYCETPGLASLKSLIDEMKVFRADIIKIACFANNEIDKQNIIALYDYYSPIIAFSLGELGKDTRLIALKKAPIVYASLECGMETGSGQYSYHEMKDLSEL